MSNSQRGPITFDRWLVLILNQKQSRDSTNPKQPLDETKETRRFIVLSRKDPRPVFNCIECISTKQGVHYPDVEIPADRRLFQVSSIARVGYIYTLNKILPDIKSLGFITDIKIQDKISIGLRFYLPV